MSFADLAGADNPAQCTGNACPVSGLTGRFGNALDFDGVDDTLTVPSLAVSLLNNAFTLDGWVYLESNANDLHALLALTDGSGNVAHLLAYQQSTQKFVYSDSVVGNQATLYVDGMAEVSLAPRCDRQPAANSRWAKPQTAPATTAICKAWWMT